ncbi:hypothetical protein ACGF5O_37830 [Streptomyces sp. NPDC048291]|uniref:hypothetical protein n=1 Tax=Streptomyces sp. NPDC048291 TaxID=3365530 RepID=UPI003714BB45
MTAATVPADLAPSLPERFALIQAAYRAVGVPATRRTEQWVSVAENVLRDSAFTTSESRESRWLLRELIATARPGGRLCTGPDRLEIRVA